MTHYSSEFEKLIEDKKKIEYLISRSGLRIGKHLVSKKIEEWKHKREFIAQAINKDGSILDIGCANGFLLRCLQGWSKHKLIPYGIDWKKKLIRQAKKLFPSQTDNFVVGDVRNFSELLGFEFPNRFDFIYWNVWNDWKPED